MFSGILWELWNGRRSLIARRAGGAPTSLRPRPGYRFVSGNQLYINCFCLNKHCVDWSLNRVGWDLGFCCLIGYCICGFWKGVKMKVETVDSKALCTRGSPALGGDTDLGSAPQS